MTDSELLSAFMAAVETLWLIFSTYVSIVFAFLVVSYLVANKLQTSLAAIVVALYTLVALWSSWALSRGSMSVTAVASQMKARAGDGTSAIGWHPAANTPDILMSAIPPLITLIAVLTYIGSIFFFYIQRKNPST